MKLAKNVKNTKYGNNFRLPIPKVSKYGKLRLKDKDKEYSVNYFIMKRYRETLNNFLENINYLSDPLLTMYIVSTLL